VDFQGVEDLETVRRRTLVLFPRVEDAREGECIDEGADDGNAPPVGFAGSAFEGGKLGEFHLVEVMKLDD
jgi:hypothetical protein